MGYIRKAPISGFDAREKNFEAKYKRDQETLFRITSRRDRLVGLRAAEQFGMPDNQALDYAKEVVLSDFEGRAITMLSAKCWATSRATVSTWTSRDYARKLSA